MVVELFKIGFVALHNIGNTEIEPGNVTRRLLIESITLL